MVAEIIIITVYSVVLSVCRRWDGILAPQSADDWVCCSWAYQLIGRTGQFGSLRAADRRGARALVADNGRSIV